MACKKDIAVVSTIGIDTGKNTLHIIGLDGKGTIVLREKVARSRIASRLVNVPPCLIGIEAGVATHYVSRELLTLGHSVKQVPPAIPSRFGKATPEKHCGAFPKLEDHCSCDGNSYRCLAAATALG